MRKKLLLINPVDYSGKSLAISPGNKYPPLGLGIVAALTPSDWDIEILDENHSKFHFKPADLVGITSTTPSANRAYKIASDYRKKKIPVVMGGVHATILPEETVNYVDSVVVGEAEGAWTQVIEDFENNKLKRIYKGGMHSMSGSPLPRRDLFHKNYWMSSLQTSRGCPMNCDFCVVPKISGKRIRYRPVKEVVDELETIKQHTLWIIDDNLLNSDHASRSRAKLLFEEIIRRGIKKEWYTFASVNGVNDEELLRLAYKSGCRMLFVGIESDDKESLKEAGKYLNFKAAEKKYRSLFHKIHKHGICIEGGVIFGFDGDTPAKIKNRISFCAKSGIDAYHLTTLTPFPGTGLFDRLKNEKRIIYDDYPTDWSKYTWKEMVFNPKQAIKEDLEKEIVLAHKKLFNKTFLRLKFIKTFLATRSYSAAKWAYYSNWYIKQSYE